MYVILIHICGISLLEILFYFYYIGPIESNLLQSSMKHIVANQEDRYYDIHYNSSYFYNNEINTELRHLRDESKHNRLEHNNQLFERSINFWCIFFSITLLVTFIQIYFKYLRNNGKGKILRVESNQNLELMPVRRRLNSNESEDNNFVETDELNALHDNNNNTQIIINDNIENDPNEVDHIVDIDDNKYLILKKKITVFYVVKKIVYYLIFIGLLLSFEFAFFQFIVLNYEPLSDNELQYIIFNELKETIVS